MAERLDFRGLKCPQPVLKTAIAVMKMPRGTTVEIMADCPTFPDDIKKWCQQTGNTLVNVVNSGGTNTATVQL